MGFHDIHNSLFDGCEWQKSKKYFSKCNFFLRGSHISLKSLGYSKYKHTHAHVDINVDIDMKILEIILLKRVH